MHTTFSQRFQNKTETGLQSVLNWTEPGLQGVLNWTDPGLQGVLNWTEQGLQGVLNWTDSRLQDTNSTKISNFEFSIIFIVTGIIAVISNVAIFFILLKYGTKRVYIYFVMSLCIGNCLIGCSVLFSTFKHFLGNSKTPFACTFSLWATTSGMLINMAMTFWISLERKLVVQNIPVRSVLWMEDRKVMIILCTFGCLIAYSSLIFLFVEDNSAHACEGVSVFGKNRPFYVTLTSCPVLCLLIINVVLHRKTLNRLSSYKIAHDQRINDASNQNTLFVKRHLDQASSSHCPSALFQSTGYPNNPVTSSLKEDTPSWTETNFGSHDNGFTNTFIDENDIVPRFDSIYCDKPTIEVTNIENNDEIADIENNDEIADNQRCNIENNDDIADNQRWKDQKHTIKREEEISWQTKCQNTVRIFIIQILIYGLSMVTGQIAASFGFLNVRYVLIGITVLCVFTCPFVYVFRVPEVKSAMQKLRRSRQIKPLDIRPSTESNKKSSLKHGNHFLQEFVVEM